MQEQNAIPLYSLTGTVILTALLLPLLSFIVSSIIRERYAWAVGLLASFTMMVATIFSAVALAKTWNNGGRIISVDWFTISNSVLGADLVINNTSMLMFFTVMLVSFLVHLYSIGYMAADMAARRYFAMLGFFTFSMQGIVLADSLLVLFGFWELVGFSSYILIGHHMIKPAAAHASKKAFIMNRVGDVGFIVGLMIVWTNAQSFDVALINQVGNGDWRTAASLCIFCGVIGKSAQFPLFSWLPDAMEGPTPVSALIHAATMVAAGVYLLVRVFPLFTPASLQVVGVIGVITALIAALSAITQHDIKKILAYSTISQLGLMMTAIAAGAPEAAFLHLFTHAFFKACLFLSAGSVIFAMHQAQQQSHLHFDVQDIRNLGGLSHKLPITMVAFCVSAASLAGVPFFAGFLSKEVILTDVWKRSNGFSQFLFFAILLISFLTVLYTFRLIWRTFFAAPGVAGLSVRESPLVMRIPITILAFASLWTIVSLNPFDFDVWVIQRDARIPLIVTVSSIVVLLAAILVAWLFRNSQRRTNSTLLENVFNIDRGYRFVYNRSLIPAAAMAGYIDKKIIDRFLHLNAFGHVTLAHVIQWIDANVIDGAVSLTTGIVRSGGFFVRKIQGGKVQVYVFWAIFAIIIFLIWALN
ncbi:MAG TPA: NADH-quinone oxidoreductase subunit L [Chryseosolibacter sp.]|nr:NADH-quinone oxidoreductase subunit L [Chryseosolibacter sp.]